MTSLQFVQPLPTPNYTKQILEPLAKSQNSLQTSCERRGGSLVGVTCVLPPPPPAPVVEPVNTYNPPVYAIQPDNWYKAWIYNEESGNNPGRWNSSGCLGLGQACPASKLLAVCPTEDYGCEDQWFTGYMLSRYHTWQNAYNFHLSHNWW